MAKNDTVKGFRDFIGSDAKRRQEIIRVLRSTFELYGFEPAETPIIEFEEFVIGENSNDEAVRDVFRLTDRGERNLALRYEFTFQLRRILKGQKLPFKRYQIGYVFRDEPIRKGRMRQFIQCDVDTAGSSISSTAETLALTQRAFKQLSLPVTLYVNNRKLINEILVTEGIEEKNREQVIREIDKLDKLSKKQVADNLKPLGAEKLVSLFTGNEKNFEKYSFYKEIQELQQTCELYGVTVTFRPYLARGLSYYNGNVFEAWNDTLGVSLAGGGEYKIGEIQATGISFGLEPLFTITEQNTTEQNTFLLVSVGKEKETIQLAERLRNKGINLQVMLDKTPGKAIEYANTKGITSIVLLGEKEVTAKKYTLKDMKTGTEEQVTEKELEKRLMK